MNLQRVLGDARTNENIELAKQHAKEMKYSKDDLEMYFNGGILAKFQTDAQRIKAFHCKDGKKTRNWELHLEMNDSEDENDLAFVCMLQYYYLFGDRQPNMVFHHLKGNDQLVEAMFDKSKRDSIFGVWKSVWGDEPVNANLDWVCKNTSMLPKNYGEVSDWRNNQQHRDNLLSLVDDSIESLKDKVLHGTANHKTMSVLCDHEFMTGYLMENRVSYHFLKFLFATSEWVDENLLETLSEQELSAVTI